MPSYRESAFIDGNGGTRFRFDNLDVRMNGGPSSNRRFIDLVGSFASFENCKFYEVGSIINPGDTLLIHNSIFLDGIYHAIINETGMITYTLEILILVDMSLAIEGLLCYNREALT